jgi:hypothetical protein
MAAKFTPQVDVACHTGMLPLETPDGAKKVWSVALYKAYSVPAGLVSEGMVRESVLVVGLLTVGAEGVAAKVEILTDEPKVVVTPSPLTAATLSVSSWFGVNPVAL